jgi:ribosomal protein L17
MEFAAALITLSGPAAEHRVHVEKALAGAKSDPLLARNLASHFIGPQSQTIAELFNRDVPPTKVQR